MFKRRNMLSVVLLVANMLVANPAGDSSNRKKFLCTKSFYA